MNNTELKDLRLKVINDISSFHDVPSLYYKMIDNIYFCKSDEILHELRTLFEINDDPYGEELHKHLRIHGYNTYAGKVLHDVVIGYLYINHITDIHSRYFLTLYDLTNKEYLIIEPGRIDISALLTAV